MKQILIILSLLFPLIPLGSQQTLTLEECRNLAIQNNKELQIAGTKIEAAGYERKEAFTNYFPKVSATGAYLWVQKDIKLVNFDNLGTVGTLIPDQVKDFFTIDLDNIWLGNVSLTQPIFAGGKIITYNQLAAYAEEVARSMNDLTLQNVIYLTDQAYWQVVSVANKKELADAYVGLLRRMNENVQAMIEEGMATQAEGLMVKVKLNEAEVAQTKAENGLVLSRMLLAKICGLPIESEPHVVDEQVSSFPVAPTPVLANVEEAFANRQELRSLELLTKISKKKERLVLADQLPTVGAMAGYLVSNPNGHNGLQHKFSGGFNAGVIVKIPISDWWGGTYKRNAARAETRIRQLELMEAKELIELEVNESVYKTNEANKQLGASAKNMESAEENLRLAMLGFEEGVIPVLNVMEAQTAWVSARSEMIDSQIEVKLTHIYLQKALGKLTPQDIE